MSTLPSIAVGVVVAAGLAAWWFACRRRPDLAVLVVLAFAVFSAHLLALLYQAGLPSGVVHNLIPVKDVLAIELAVVVGVRRVRQPGGGLRRLAVPVSLLLLVGLLGLQGLGTWPLSDVALSGRNVAVAVTGLLTAILLTEAERARAVSVGIPMVAAAAGYALVEYALPVGFVRDVVGVGDYWRDVKEQSYHLSQQGTGLPGNFFTSAGARRLSGTFGDPLAAGYALAAWLVLGLLSRRTPARTLCCVVMGAALLLTFTRGGFVLVGTALLPLAAVLALRGRRRRALGFLVAAGASFLALLAIPAYRRYVTDVLTGQDDSTKAHIDAMVHSVDYSYTLLGDGFAAAGGPVGRGTESVLVTIALQVGIVGLVLYLVAGGLLLLAASTRWAAQGYRAAFVGLSAGVVLTMLISEQLLTFNAGWVLGLALGLAPAGATVQEPATDSGDSSAVSAAPDRSRPGSGP